MSREMTFSDEELTAYLDGETEFARTEEIDAALANDPELQARLDDLQIDRDALTKAFDAYIADAPGLPDLDVPTAEALKTPSRRSLMKMALAASVSGLIGIGIGTQFQRPALAGWREYVAAYHALYTRETLSAVPFDATTAGATLARAAAEIGKVYDVDTLQRTDTMQYRRAQILAFEGRAILQLSFVLADGTPVALCITRRPGTAQATVTAATMENLSTAIWSKDGYEYILIGGREQNTITAAAEFFAAHL